jgi:hypothetical protein
MRRVVYFYSATSRRYRGAMWSIFTPALIGLPSKRPSGTKSLEVLAPWMSNG